MNYLLSPSLVVVGGGASGRGGKVLGHDMNEVGEVVF